MAISLADFSNLELAGIWFPLLIFGLVGTAGNGIIVYLYITSKDLKTPMNLLFVNLTVGDLIVSVFGTLVSAFYTISNTVMQQGVCEWYGFITFLGGKSLVSK